MDLASKLFKGDRVIWIIFMFLCLISVVEVFSATSTIAYKNANHWRLSYGTPPFYWGVSSWYCCYIIYRVVSSLRLLYYCRSRC